MSEKYHSECDTIQSRRRSTNPTTVLVIVVGSIIAMICTRPSSSGNHPQVAQSTPASTTPGQVTLPIPTQLNPIFPGQRAVPVVIPTPSPSTIQKVDGAIQDLIDDVRDMRPAVKQAAGLAENVIGIANDGLNQLKGTQSPLTKPQTSSTAQQIPLAPQP